jgi:type IV secretion system protein VirD4
MPDAPHPETEETLYRLPTYDHAAAQAVLAATVLGLLFDLLLALTTAASALAARWGRPAGLGPPWLHFPAYPHRPLLATAILLAAGLATLTLPGRPATPTGAARPTHPTAPSRIRPAAALLLLPLLAALLLAACIPIYPPLDLLRWSARFQHLPALAPALRWARELCLATFCAAAAATLAHTFARLRRLRETGDTHGSSHWATAAEVRATGLLDPAPPAIPPPAVVVGAWRDPRGTVHTLRDARDRHVLAFAPSGTGKTSCLVVPTLLEWPAAAVVLDVKGELWHLTAAHRQQTLHHHVLRFDPACADGTAARYNPLLLIPRTLEDVKYAQSVADVLVDPDGRDAPRSFWEQSAHSLLVATLLHVLYAAPHKTLAACAHLLSDPASPIRNTLEIMLATHHDPALTLHWRDPATGQPTPTHPAIAAAARTLLDMDPRTSSGVIATAQSHLDLFRDPILAANTAASDFTADDLLHSHRPLTLYITLAPADLDRLRGLVRLVLNQLCRRLTERLDFNPQAPRRPLLLLLDEFTALGKLDFFGRALAYLRGYNIRVYISIQALVQLHQVYGEHQSITANCPLQIAFAPADVHTADLLSKMTGQRTVNLTTRSLSGASLVLAPRRTTIARQAHGRPLLTPDEVRRLPDGEALVFVAGHAPIRGRREPYYRSAERLGCTRTAPPQVSDRIPQPESAWAGWQANLPPAGPGGEEFSDGRANEAQDHLFD